MLFKHQHHSKITSSLRGIISLLFLISSFPISAGNIVKVNTDKKKLKGDGAVEGQIIVASTHLKSDGSTSIRPEWTNFSVNSAQITDGSVNTTDLADDSVSSIKLISDAVSTSKILDNTIEGEDLDDTTITARSMANGVLPATYVVDASGNGHFTNLQEALDALPTTGGKIFVQAGTYTITESIIISTSNVTIEGCGPSSLIYAPSALAGAVVIFTGDQITVKNLMIKNNNANDTGILISSSDNSLIADCTISSQGIGIDSQQSNSLIMQNNRIKANLGITITNSSNGIIQNNLLTTTSTGIITSVNSIKTSIQNNHIDILNAIDLEMGIYLQGTGTSYTSVTNNILTGGVYGIFSEHSRVTIAQNIITSSSSYGIVLQSYRNNVTGNIAGDGGIACSGGGFHAIFSNTADIIDGSSSSQPQSANGGTINSITEFNRS